MRPLQRKPRVLRFPRSVGFRVMEVWQLHGLRFLRLRLVVIGLTDCSSECKGKEITSGFCFDWELH